MKGNLIKIDFKIILICSLFFALTFSANVGASNLKPNDGSASIKECISQGNINFLTFINSVIYSDSISEGILEPWKDITSRNKCQSSDVYSLIIQRDKIRSLIRSAYLTCKPDKILDLRYAFYKANAEIYYVRHVVDGQISVGLPYTSLKLKKTEDASALYADPNVIMEAIKKRYVGEEKISEKQFPLFYENLVKKYEKRKEKYILCDEDLSFKDLGDKFDKNKKKIGDETKKAYDDSVKRLGGRVENLVEGVNDVGFKDTIASMFKININKMTPMKSYEDFLKNSSYLGSNPTAEDALSHLYTESRTFDKETLKKQLEAHFESLYRIGNDNAVEVMMEELALTDLAVIDGTKSLGKLLDCIKRLDKKQCSETK